MCVECVRCACVRDLLWLASPLLVRLELAVLSVLRSEPARAERGGCGASSAGPRASPSARASRHAAHSAVSMPHCITRRVPPAAGPPQPRDHPPTHTDIVIYYSRAIFTPPAITFQCFMRVTELIERHYHYTTAPRCCSVADE